MIIGLTGLIGSGKTLASQIFAKLGFFIIDTDIIANNLLLESEVSQLIINKFRSIIVDSKGKINKKKLSELVFADVSHLKILESILHPLILKQVEQQILWFKTNNQSIKLAMIVVPLLFKCPIYLKLIHQSLLIDSKYDVLVDRLLKRELNKKQIDNIIKNQMPIAEQRQQADDIIVNNDSKNNFINKINMKSRYYYNILNKYT